MSDRVLILSGGLSPERDVSIRSGRRVAEELRELGLEVQVSDLDQHVLPGLLTDPPACALPLVHGAAGEDGSVQELLELAGIPFIGSDANACRRSFDKSVAVALLADSELQVPESISLPHAAFRELGANAVLELITRRLGFPLVVKPTRGGSALGVTVVRGLPELPAAMVAAMSYGDTVLLEQFIAGTEVAVSVVELDEGPVALPPVEIVPDSGMYDYVSRYTAGTTEFFVPARLPAAQLTGAEQCALTAHRLLGLRDWSRTDLIIDADGVPWFLEVNVVPGMTETSLFPQAALAAGRPIGPLVAGLIDRAGRRPLRKW